MIQTITQIKRYQLPVEKLRNAGRITLLNKEDEAVARALHNATRADMALNSEKGRVFGHDSSSNNLSNKNNINIVKVCVPLKIRASSHDPDTLNQHERIFKKFPIKMRSITKLRVISSHDSWVHQSIGFV